MSCSRSLMEGGRVHSAGAAPTTVGSLTSSNLITAGGGAGAVKHHHVGGVTDDALLHFSEAMSLVEPGEKEAWARAQEKCPAAVWDHECCPCFFLVACRFNPWDAAVRMCSYWKERVNLFEERAFEPITLGSDLVPPSGFTEGDVKVLERGSFYLLPADRKGRTIVFVDESRLEPAMLELPKTRLRALWYTFQCGYTSGEEGAHRVVPLVSCLKPPLNGVLSQARWQFAAGAMKLPSCLPIIIDSLHLLTLPSKTGTGRILQAVLSIAASMQNNYVSSLTTVHNGVARASDSIDDGEDAEAKASLLIQLKALGFTKKGLPQWAGGLFTMDDFRAWVKRRRRIEQKLFWTAEQHAIQKRGVNRIHSRQKRQRRLEDVRDLQDQIKCLEEENSKARLAHASLEQLLMSANQTVSRFREDTLMALPLPPKPATGSAWIGDAAVAPESPRMALTLDLLASLEPDPIAPSCVPSHSAAAASVQSYNGITGEGMHGWDGGEAGAGMETTLSPFMARPFHQVEESLPLRNSLPHQSLSLSRSLHSEIGYTAAMASHPASSLWMQRNLDHDAFRSPDVARSQFLLHPQTSLRRQVPGPHESVMGSSDWISLQHEPLNPAVGVAEVHIAPNGSLHGAQGAVPSYVAMACSAIHLTDPAAQYSSHLGESSALRFRMSQSSHSQRPEDDGVDQLSYLPC